MLLPQNIVANFDGLVRHDSMEGKDYLVAPMVMLTEGVHAGSNGPLYYPTEELGKTPAVWNGKPVVVYHPVINGEQVSANDPDVYTNHRVGTIMNTRFEDGKLKAEAWLEEMRCAVVDNRIIEAIEEKKMMELSTGVFTDNESADKGAEWNGEPYDYIARNYRPDHLALLPDLKGACSIKDGAGFLRLNKLVLNVMSHGDIRSLLNSALREKNTDAWIEDVYDSYFIFEQGGKFQKQTYTNNNSKIELTGTPVEVFKVTEYRTATGAVVTNKETIMKTKKQIVDGLIANEKSNWAEEDRDDLMVMDRKVLNKLEAAFNVNEQTAEQKKAVDDAAAEGGKDVAAPEASEEKTETPAESKAPGPASEQAVENQKPVTAKEYIKSAPPEIASVLTNGLRQYESAKARLIKVITANDRNTFTEAQLKAKELTELEQLAKLAANTDEEQEAVSQTDFSGQAPVTENIEQHVEEPLDTPTLNFEDEKSRQQKVG